jgi:hypothetical protein
MTRTFAVVLRAAALVAAASCPSSAYAQSPPFHPPVARDFAAELACAPNAAETAPVQALRVTGGQVAGRNLFGSGETVHVGAGTAQGIETGQDYFVRRVVSDPFNAHYPDGATHHQIHTAGWIHIAEVHAGDAVATVTHACDEVMAGDYLEPFALPTVPEPAAPGEADLTGAGRLVFGDEWAELGGPGSYMVLNRGSLHGLHPGQRITIFRSAADAGPPGLMYNRRSSTPSGLIRVGEATAMLVRPGTTTVRVDRSDGVIYVGDVGAINR